MSNNNALVHILEAETYNQRLERMREYQDVNHKYPNIQAVLTRPEGRNTVVKEWFLGSNIVTNAGDVYYAQQGAGESPTNDFAGASARFRLRTGSPLTPAKSDTYTQFTNPVANSLKAIDGTYPKTNDTTDSDNTGDAPNAVSYRVSYTTGDFNATNITGGVIVATASPTTGTPLLTHFTITSFDKTASDTLKLFVNHALAGV